jgi:hypothetical protein
MTTRTPTSSVENFMDRDYNPLCVPVVPAAGGDRRAHDGRRSLREIDRLASEMVRTGVPSDGVKLVVVDQAGRTTFRVACQPLLSKG